MRPIDEVIVWNRTPARAHALVTLLREQGVRARVAQPAEEATKSAEIVCTLTPAAEPILRGEWLAAGQHLNVVGAPPRVDHREVDGVAMARADVVVDSVANTLAKSGDALLALAEGAITHADLDVELGQVIAGTKPGRRSSEAITLFNSLGMGLQDLAAADIVYRAATAAASLALRS